MVFTAVLVLVPGVVIGLVAERSGRDSLKQVIGGQLAREAEHTAGRISSLLRAERDTLRSFARQDVMREIRVGDIDKRISRALATLRDGSAVRLDYLVADNERRVVAASSPALIEALPAWARAPAGLPRADGGVVDLASPYAHEAGLVLTAPVPDPDTREATLGHLVGLLDWKLLTTLTEGVSQDLAEQGIAAQILVVRADGAALGAARSAEERPGVSRASWSSVVAGIGSDADYVVDTELGLIVGRAPLGSGIPDFPDWKLLVAEPLSHAFAPARRLRKRIALVMALALASALAVATLAARRVTSPLSELTLAIRGLSRGDPAVLRVPVRARDEVGSLAAAFNHMASELDRVQRNLVEAEKFAFVGELASGIAHEVRTSLGVLRSSVQILERSLPPDADGDAAELAQLIRAEADRLGGVVDDLLSLDRPRPLHLQPLPVSQAVFRAADFVEPQAEEKGIRLRRRPASREATVLCDSEAIHQVAVNLLVNAVEALGEGGTIEVEILEANEGYAGFAVKDDGSGVPEALRDRIFQPFVTARDGGVGLGLTFVKRVVHEHQGRIFLEPGSGAGACFRVELPIVEEHE
jgi:signal transduction histidine kinase